jgi:hypothetical protein
MVDHSTDTPCTNGTEPYTAPGTIPTEWFSPVSLLSNPLNGEISLPVLAALCVKELNAYRRGEPYTDTYSVELLRRATVQGDQDARAWMQHCFGDVVLDWLHCHPKKAHACRLESEEHYVAQAFECFWQATVSNQRVEFTTLAAALHYLRASLYGAILDMLRANARSSESSRPVPAEPGEPHLEDMTSSHEIWEMLKALLVHPREQRLAYLLIHCGLSPREIVRGCPQEWSDVQEIALLRRTIMERLLSHADQLALVPPSCDPDGGSMVF